MLLANEAKTNVEDEIEEVPRHNLYFCTSKRKHIAYCRK